MHQIPNMWREELLHPLAVHFPIALLVSLPIAFFIFLIFYKYKALQALITFNLSLGVLTSWIAIYTGDQAESVVNRVICDPTVTHLHADWAYYSTYIFSTLFILWLARHFISSRYDRIIIALLTSISLVGAASLTYAGHLGARLVYQQGAAVYQPSPECTEFE